MKVTTQPEPPVIRLSLRECGNYGVALVATFGETEQDILIFDTKDLSVPPPSPHAPHPDTGLLFCRTVQVRENFPIDKDDQGHARIHRKTR